jgi:hypothetical protein
MSFKTMNLNIKIRFIKLIVRYIILEKLKNIEQERTDL